MGLADFKARLRLFFATKLREWANSIDENALSPPLQPPSIAVKKRGSEPLTETEPDHEKQVSEPSHPFTRLPGGPPQHWIDLVRERAPELLSLSREYPPNEAPLPEDHVHAHPSIRDDEAEVPDQPPVNVPTEVPRKPTPIPFPPSRLADKRAARKLTRAKSFLSGLKPLTLKPLTKPNPYPQSPRAARDRVTEPAKLSQLIEDFGTDEKTVTLPERSSLGSVAKKDQIATHASARQRNQQAAQSDKTSANYGTNRTAPSMIPAAQAHGELTTSRKSEVQRPAFNVVRKTQSGPRTYLRAIASVIRKTLGRTTSGAGQPSNAITSVNLLVDSSSKDSSSTSKVVLFAESSKTPVKHETSFASVNQQSAKKASPIVYPNLAAPETTRRPAAPPATPRASIKNVKTASRQPAPAFPRPVNRFADVSHTRIQDAFVNMPALMDEEKMNRASSVHLADLRPGKNQWPDLPSEPSTEMADDLVAHERDRDRMRRLEQEQRGTSWNV